uniref:Uncharacterized protein n=1 Tax=Ciona intestinalis TaxID=7719 RepID=F6QCL6_CIOIN
MNAECSSEVPSYVYPSVLTICYILGSYVGITYARGLSTYWFEISIGVLIGLYILGAAIYMILRKMYTDGRFQSNFGQVEHLWTISNQSMTTIKRRNSIEHMEVISLDGETTNEK